MHELPPAKLRQDKGQRSKLIETRMEVHIHLPQLLPFSSSSGCTNPPSTQTNPMPPTYSSRHRAFLPHHAIMEYAGSKTDHGQKFRRAPHRDSPDHRAFLGRRWGRCTGRGSSQVPSRWPMTYATRFTGPRCDWYPPVRPLFSGATG